MWTRELIWFNLGLTGRTSRDSGRRFAHRPWMVKRLTEKQGEFDNRDQAARPIWRGDGARQQDRCCHRKTAQGWAVLLHIHMDTYTYTHTPVDKCTCTCANRYGQPSVPTHIQLHLICTIKQTICLGRLYRLYIVVLILHIIRDMTVIKQDKMRGFFSL